LLHRDYCCTVIIAAPCYALRIREPLLENFNMTDPFESDPYTLSLRWLDSQQDAMVELLLELCDQNSGTFNVDGVTKVVDILQREYQGLGDELHRHDTPPARLMNDAGEHETFPLGPNLQVACRLEQASRAFLCIHTDTVYDTNSPFQKCQYLDDQTLNGPGVIDAKGGQVVMLFALRAFERSPLAKKMGWRVLMNPDEEIGSLGSGQILKELAADCQFGLLFEPVLPDGSMVAARKGSGNFSIVCRGRSAHSGRDFENGRNAVVHLARCIDQIDRLNGTQSDGSTYNLGRIQGGGPVNMVPDLAVARLNIRVVDPTAQVQALRQVQSIVDQFDQAADYQVELEGIFSSPPKVVDSNTKKIQQRIQLAAQSIGLPLSWRDTGGASDGNKLSGIGLPNVDTLGPAGNHLHSPKEFLVVKSLIERAKLTTLVLLQMADQPIDWS